MMLQVAGAGATASGAAGNDAVDIYLSSTRSVESETAEEERVERLHNWATQKSCRARHVFWRVGYFVKYTVDRLLKIDVRKL